jgi:peptide/nickel transport system permease protein
VVGFLVRRLLAMIPLLLIITFVAWALVLLVPGDPAVTLAGEGASPETIAALRQEMGLNDPIPVQYLRWLDGAVQGNLGRSFFSGVPVITTILQRLPVTISLAAYATVLAILIALPLGSVAALRPGSAVDRGVTSIATAGIAMPSFWFAGLLLIAFVVLLRLFPGTGFVPITTDPAAWAWHLTLPALALSVSVGAQLMRQVRAALIGVLQEDYIRTARSKGIGGYQILVRHALRNAAPPVITVLGLRITSLLEGTVIVESMFGLPGVGLLIVQSAFNHDLHVIQGVTLMFTLLVLAMNLFVDICYAWLNPRVRLA